MLHLRHRTVAWSRLVSPRSAEWSNEDNGFLASLSPCPAPPIIMHYSEPSSGENYFLHNKYSCRLFRFVMGEEENRMRGIIGFCYHGSGHICCAGIWRHSAFCRDERKMQTWLSNTAHTSPQERSSHGKLLKTSDIIFNGYLPSRTWPVVSHKCRMGKFCTMANFKSEIG